MDAYRDVVFGGQGADQGDPFGRKGARIVRRVIGVEIDAREAVLDGEPDRLLERPRAWSGEDESAGIVHVEPSFSARSGV